MPQLMQILTIMLVATAMAPALAHAFEFPGKRRLSKDAYVAVQGIYYPGFTLLGIAEPVGMIALIVLLLFTPPGTTAFWLTLFAFVGLLSMQVVFWTLTQPTNKFWLHHASVTTGKAGGAFFGLDPARQSATQGQSATQMAGGEGEWRKLRDRWEYSHIARAGLAFLSLLCLVLAIVTH